MQYSGGSRSFAKNMRALKMRSASGSWQQSRAIIKADPLTTIIRSCQKTHHQPFYGHLAFEANWKGSVTGCFMSWLEIKNSGALARPRGIGWRGRWEGGSGWGIHVNPWLSHVNVWQKPLQYCKVISLQLLKINEKK